MSAHSTETEPHCSLRLYCVTVLNDPYNTHVLGDLLLINWFLNCEYQSIPDVV